MRPCSPVLLCCFNGECIFSQLHILSLQFLCREEPTLLLFFSCSGICVCQRGLVDVCFILCLQHHGIFSVPSFFLFVNSFPNTGKSSSHHLQNFYLFNPRTQNKGDSEVQTLGILLLFAAYEVFCPSKGYLFVSFTDKILFFYSSFLPKG